MMLSKKTLNAVLLTIMALPMLTFSAFAQQEVDPTYYDPWAAPIKVVARAYPKPAESGKAQKVTAASAAQPKNRKRIRTQEARRADQTATVASVTRPAR